MADYNEQVRSQGACQINFQCATFASDPDKCKSCVNYSYHEDCYESR